MVKIPEFTARTSPTTQTGTRARPVTDVAAAAAAPFEAAAELAGDVQRVSTRFYEAQKSLQRKTEASKQIDYLIKGDENNPGLNQLMFDAQNNPDTNTALPNFEQGFNSHKNKILQTIKDPVVQQIVGRKADELYTNNYIDVQSAVWKNVRENSIDTLKNNIQFEFNQYQTAGGNKAKKNTSLQNIAKLIEDANNDGLGLPDNYYDTQMKNLYTLEAEKLASDNPNLFLQNYEDGFYNDKINPENLMALEKNAKVNQQKIIKDTKSTIKSQATTLKNDVQDYKDITSQDSRNISTFNDLLTRALTINDQLQAIGEPGIPDIIEDLQIEAFIFDEIDIAKTKTPIEVKEQLDDVRSFREEMETKEDVNTFQQKAALQLEDKLESILSKMQTESKDNLLNMAEEFDPNLQIAELDLFDMDTQSFFEKAQARYEQSHAIADKYGVPVQFIKPEEKREIKNFLETSTSVQEIANVLTNLTILGRDDTKTIFNNMGMGKDAPLYSHLGLFLYANNGKLNEASTSIINGIIAKKNDLTNQNIKMIKENLVDKFALTNILNEYQPPSLKVNTPNLMNQIVQTAEIIFADKVNRNEGSIVSDPDRDVTKELYEESVQMAAGLTKREGEYYGGFQVFGDNNKILLPQNMPNGEAFMENSKKNTGFPTVKELLEDRLTPELLKKAFTFEIQEEDPRTGYVNMVEKTIVPYDAETNKQMKMEDFLDEDGKFIDSLYLETAHDGMYYITIGNPNDGDGLYFIDETGREILFNLKKIVPDLISGL